MVRVTYHGNEAGEGTVWHGIEFPVGVPVEVDHPLILAKVAHNTFFTAEVGVGATPHEGPFGRGVMAAQAGKSRSVPPAYRGKPEAEEWLAGYDSQR